MTLGNAARSGQAQGLQAAVERAFAQSELLRHLTSRVLAGRNQAPQRGIVRLGTAGA